VTSSSRLLEKSSCPVQPGQRATRGHASTLCTCVRACFAQDCDIRKLCAGRQLAGHAAEDTDLDSLAELFERSACFLRAPAPLAPHLLLALPLLSVCGHSSRCDLLGEALGEVILCSLGTGQRRGAQYVSGLPGTVLWYNTTQCGETTPVDGFGACQGYRPVEPH